MKTVADVAVSNVDKHSISGEPLVKLCNYVDVYKNTYINSTLQFMESTASEEQVRRYSLRTGDIILTKDSESSSDIAVPALVTENVPFLVCGYHLAVVRPDPSKVNPRFLLRAFQARTTAHYFTTSANGITRYGLTYYSLKNAPLPIPTLSEQEAIADFLDRETAEADALVGKYERLVKVLEEKRIALVTRAVTSGITATVPMKDTLIEWIGKIPQHWNLKPLKRLLTASLAYGVLQPDYSQDADSARMINVWNIEGAHILPDGLTPISRQQSLEYKRTIVQAGDLIYSIVGSFGRVAVITPDLAGCNLARSLSVIRVDDGQIDVNFMRYYLGSFAAANNIEAVALGSAQLRLNLGDLGDFHIPVPPLNEQRKIVKYLDRENSQIEASIGRTKLAIEIVKEHRAALIDAAVTGNIDVTNYRSNKVVEISA